MKTSGCSNRLSRVKLSRRGIYALPRRHRNTKGEAGNTKSVKGHCLGRRHVGYCHINWLLSFQKTTLLACFSMADTQRSLHVALRRPERMKIRRRPRVLAGRLHHKTCPRGRGGAIFRGGGGGVKSLRHAKLDAGPIVKFIPAKPDSPDLSLRAICHVRFEIRRRQLSPQTDWALCDPPCRQ
jgi:hypothetical protein